MIQSTIATPNTLGKQERVKSRKLIGALFDKGKAITCFPLRAVYLVDKASEQPLQAGFSVSKRNFKKATDRNRVKRLMRECYRVQKDILLHSLTGQDRSLAVFLIYTARELPEYEPLKSKMLETLTLLSKKLQQDLK